MAAIIRIVNVGTPRPREWAEIGRTAIEKHPVTGPVRVRRRSASRATRSATPFTRAG